VPSTSHGCYVTVTGLEAMYDGKGGVVVKKTGVRE